MSVMSEWSLTARDVWADMGRSNRELWRAMWLDSSSMSIDEFAERFGPDVRAWLAERGYQHDPEWAYELAVEIWPLARRG